MSSANLKQLWSGLMYGQFEEYDAINSQLVVSPTMRGEYFLRFPFVIYVMVRPRGCWRIKPNAVFFRP
jgi:hypothetical protein